MMCVYRWIAAQHSQDFHSERFLVVTENSPPKNVEISGDQEGESNIMISQVVLQILLVSIMALCSRKDPFPYIFLVFRWLVGTERGGVNTTALLVQQKRWGHSADPRNLHQTFGSCWGERMGGLIDRVIFVRSKCWISGVYQNDHPRVS